MEFSLSNRDVSRTLCFLSQVEWTPRGPDYKEGPISLQWLKFRLFFISQDEGTSKSPVETVEKAVGVRLIWTGVSHPFDPSRGTWNSMIHKVTMPDSS